MKSLSQDRDLRAKVRRKIKNDYNIDLSEEDVIRCLDEMEMQKLSIFHGHLYPDRRARWAPGKPENGQMFIKWERTIDGWRAIAIRSGAYAGRDAPIHDYGEDKTRPLKTTVTVYRLDKSGHRYPYIGEAYYEENAQTKQNGAPNRFWKENPVTMMAKTAEKNALRAAFQQDDFYVQEVTYDPVQENLDKIDEEQSKNTARKYQEFDLYKDGRRIVSMRVRDNDILAFLDNGNVVVMTRDFVEVEVDVADENDVPVGGREWSIGDAYYDASKVLSATTHRGNSMVLELDNGFKVMLDRYGKEIRRKKEEVISIKNRAIKTLEEYNYKNKKTLAPNEALKLFTGAVVKLEEMSDRDWAILASSLEVAKEKVA